MINTVIPMTRKNPAANAAPKTIGDRVRAALHHDLNRQRHDEFVDMETSLDLLRRALADDVRDATDWQDLQTRLQRKGYQFARGSGGLSVQDLAGRHICKAADLRQAETVRLAVAS